MLRDSNDLAYLALGATFLCLVGLADDAWGLRGRQKLIGQMLAIGIIMAGGLRIEYLRVFDWTVDLGVFGPVFTMLWLLGAINSINLLDGADGLASTIGAILCLTIGVLAVLTHAYDDAILAITFGGAILGFLIYNFPPASIFLGDTGSMLIGLVVGTLAIRSSLKGPATLALATPIAVLALPMFDSCAAVLRRKLTGRSIYATDRGHLHHCLLRVGFGSRQLLGAVALLSLATAIGALWSVYSQNELFSLLSVMAIVGILTTTGVFGRVESILLAQRLASIGASFAMRPGLPNLNGTRRSSVQLQGSRNWERAWEMMIESTDKLDITYLQLDLNIPWLHEAYHASWSRESGNERDKRRWKLEVPLQLEGRAAGLVVMMGRSTSCQSGAVIQTAGDLVESVETIVAQLALSDDFEVSSGGDSEPRDAASFETESADATSRIG